MVISKSLKKQISSGNIVNKQMILSKVLHNTRTFQCNESNTKIYLLAHDASNKYVWLCSNMIFEESMKDYVEREEKIGNCYKGFVYQIYSNNRHPEKSAGILAILDHDTLIGTYNGDMFPETQVNHFNEHPVFKTTVLSDNESRCLTKLIKKFNGELLSARTWYDISKNLTDNDYINKMHVETYLEHISRLEMLYNVIDVILSPEEPE